MNWFKKATITMGLDWNTAYQELLKELGRKPTMEEIRQRMYEDSPTTMDFSDPETNYDDIPF
jgi:hypothetical protein